MPKFGRRSNINLTTCHPKLQRLFREVVKTYDCSILYGHRGEDEQNAAFYDDKSTKKWPDSKHNSVPSMAIDVAPWPINWDNIDRFSHFAGYVQCIADQMGIKVAWGGWWNHPKDYVHWQLKE